MQDAYQGQLIPDVAGCLTARHGKGPDSDGSASTLIPFDSTQITHPDNRSNPRPGDPCHTLPAHGAPPAVAFNHQGGGTQTTLGFDQSSGVTAALIVGQVPAVIESGVRRLTPRECERLQGFPDDYTLIPLGRRKPKPAADGPRYKALGNSMAVPVMAWIGRRIAAVDAIPG